MGGSLDPFSPLSSLLAELCSLVIIGVIGFLSSSPFVCLVYVAVVVIVVTIASSSERITITCIFTARDAVSAITAAQSHCIM